MDTLHTMLRAIRGSTKSSPDHLTVFREFLAHLDKVQPKAPATRAARLKPGRRRTTRRSKI